MRRQDNMHHRRSSVLPQVNAGRLEFEELGSSTSDSDSETGMPDAQSRTCLQSAGAVPCADAGR